MSHYLPKTLSKRLLFCAITAGIAFFAATTLILIGGKATEPNKSVSPIYDNGAKFPARLKIPKIDVDAAIEHVGRTSEGAMDVPAQPEDVAWLNLTPLPGELGSAVIDGHSGYKNNRPAVFDNLYSLRKGDKIYIEDGKGETTAFVVQKFRTYGPNEDASNVFSSNDDKAHLNLVTCYGAWNEAERTHSDRLVVFAEKEQ